MATRTKSRGKPKPKTGLGNLAASVADALEDVDGLWVVGEVTRLKKLDNGMLKFDLGNEEARFSITVFSRTAEAAPAFGEGSQLKVEVGRLTYYAPYGKIEAIAEDIELPDGAAPVQPGAMADDEPF